MMLRCTIVVCCAATLSACSDNRTPAPIHANYDAGSLPQLTCVPNLDGQIDSSELSPALNIPARYLVSPQGKTRTVDLIGAISTQGRRTWDFGADYADDQTATISAVGLSGKWYAASFPTATFTTPFDAGGSTEAIYSYNSNAIALLGLASKNVDGPGGKTLLVYTPPITVYRFPLSVGSRYTSTGTISGGTLRGQPYAGKDTYDINVDASGEVKLAAYSFTQALRVRTSVTVEPSAGMAITTKQTQFLFECFGEIARATSQTGETNDDFTTAAELRRLGQ